MAERKKARAGTLLDPKWHDRARMDWRTPPHLLQAVRVYFGGPIPFDAATDWTNPTNALAYAALPPPGPCRHLLTEPTLDGWRCMGCGWLDSRVPLKLQQEGHRGAGHVATNGLRYPWHRRTFVNPPYGKAMPLWLAKIASEARRGCEIVALLPASRWEQSYFTRALESGNALTPIRGRVKFVNPLTGEEVGGNPTANIWLGANVDLVRWRRAFELTAGSPAATQKLRAGNGERSSCFELRTL